MGLRSGPRYSSLSEDLVYDQDTDPVSTLQNLGHSSISMKPLTAAHSTLQASMKAALSSILLSDTDRSNASFSLVTSIKQNNNQNFPPMESLQVIYSIHEGIKYLHIYDETTSQLYSYDTSLNNTKVIDLSLISVKKEVNALKKEVSPRRKEAVKSEEMKFGFKNIDYNLFDRPLEKEYAGKLIYLPLDQIPFDKKIIPIHPGLANGYMFDRDTYIGSHKEKLHNILTRQKKLFDTLTAGINFNPKTPASVIKDLQIVVSKHLTAELVDEENHPLKKEREKLPKKDMEYNEYCISKGIGDCDKYSMMMILLWEYAKTKFTNPSRKNIYITEGKYGGKNHIELGEKIGHAWNALFMFTDDHIYTTQFDLTLYDGSAYDSKKRPDIFEYHTSKDNDVITGNLYFGIAQYGLAAKYYHTSLQQFNDLDSKAAQEINTIYTISMQKYIQKLILLSQDEIILKKDIYIRGLIDMATENKQIYTFIISLERDISFFDEYPEWQALKDSYK